MPIYAETLQDRLPATLVVAEQREREIYGVTEQAEIEPSSRAIASSSNLRAQRGGDGRTLSHHRELLARAYPPLTRRVSHASAVQQARPRLISRRVRGKCLGRATCPFSPDLSDYSGLNR